MTLSPHELPDDAETLKAMMLAARAENTRLDAVRQRLAHEEQVLAAEVDRLTAQNEPHDHIVSVLRRAQFGRRSERISIGAKHRIDEEQIELALEDVEMHYGIENAAAEKADSIVRTEGTKARRANRGYLPAHLAREEVVIQSEAKACAVAALCTSSARTCRNGSTDPGPAARDRDTAPEICLPQLHGRRGASAGSEPAARGSEPNREHSLAGRHPLRKSIQAMLHYRTV